MRRLSLFLVPGSSCLFRAPHQTNLPKLRRSSLKRPAPTSCVRYYSEEVSRVLKPLQTESLPDTFSKRDVVDLAKQQSGRELAVVILLQFNASDAVKREWLTMLQGVGYKRIVFLRAQSGMKINGLPILENPSEITDQPKTDAGPHV